MEAQDATDLTVTVRLTPQQMRALADGRAVDVTIRLMPPQGADAAANTADGAMGDGAVRDAGMRDGTVGSKAGCMTRFGDATLSEAVAQSAVEERFETAPRSDGAAWPETAAPTEAATRSVSAERSGMAVRSEAVAQPDANAQSQDMVAGGIGETLRSAGASQPTESAAAWPAGSGAAANAGNASAGDSDDETVVRRAVISMDSTSNEAETLFRSAIVSLEGIPGNQVEGISPLYHVSAFSGPDAMSAVVMVSTRLGARNLVAALGAIEAAHADQLDLDLVDMEGVTSGEPDCTVPWPSASHRAAVLAPWLDMDPDARLGGDPVAFLLAMAPDAERVGMLSDNWIIGGTA